jgi:acetylornithine deacetylase/succinyl-diaminopimelate desuccinylase-like protein
VAESAADVRRLVAAAVDPEPARRDLVELVRTPSVTGDERAVQDLVAELLAEIGCTVERIETDPAAFAATDPDWPGEEMARTDLPVVVGRLGRAGQPTLSPVRRRGRSPRPAPTGRRGSDRWLAG